MDVYGCGGGGSMRGSDFFFFQAEDGIRDRLVTGVQTCALPIYSDGGRDGVQHEDEHLECDAK